MSIGLPMTQDFEMTIHNLKGLYGNFGIAGMLIVKRLNNNIYFFRP